MGFTHILSTKLRSKKTNRSVKDDDATTTNHSKTTSTALLRSVSLGSGFMPSSGTITPPLTPIDDDDDYVEEPAVGVDTFNKKQKTASFLSSTAASTELPNRSVLLRISGKTTHDDRLPHDFGDESYPIGIPFEVESDLFVGKALLRVKGLANSDDPEGDKYFSGRCRTYQHVIQGRFKEEIPLSEFQSGYELYRPLRRLPPKAILKICIELAKKLNPSIELSIHTDKSTTVLGTLASCKIVRADKPGEEVDIACHNIKEDCTLLGGAFAKGNVSARRRRRILSDPTNLKDYKFDTDTVYTFDFYEWIADLNKWTLPLGFTSIDLEQILGRQPIHWIGKTGDRYIWSGGIINRKLLPEEQPTEEEDDMLGD